MAANRGSISDKLLDRGERLSVATMHEAAGRCGALPDDLRPLDSAMRVIGRALPVRCPSGDNLWIHRAIARARPQDVIIVEVGASGTAFGYWGEIMASAAIARGVAGLVINGGVRDSTRLIELGLPTFSARITVRGTTKDPAKDGAVGEPIRLGDVIIRHGDLVLGDADGVIALTPNQARRAIPASERREADERDIIERIGSGALTIDIYNL